MFNSKREREAERRPEPKIMPPARQVREQREPTPHPSLLQPLAQKAAEYEQYVRDLEGERDRLKQQMADQYNEMKRELGEASNEIHLLKSTLQAIELDNQNLKEIRDKYAEQLIEVKTEAKVAAAVILGVLKKLDPAAAPSPVSEYAPKPRMIEPDMDRLAEQMLKPPQ